MLHCHPKRNLRNQFYRKRSGAAKCCVVLEFLVCPRQMFGTVVHFCSLELLKRCAVPNFLACPRQRWCNTFASWNCTKVRNIFNSWFWQDLFLIHPAVNFTEINTRIPGIESRFPGFAIGFGPYKPKRLHLIFCRTINSANKPMA